MAEDADDDIDAEAEGEGAEGEEGGKKPGLMKLALFIGLPVVIVLLGGVAAWLLLFSGGDEPQYAEGEEGAEYAEGYGEEAEPATPALPELFVFESPVVVDISESDGRRAVLSVNLALAYTDAAVGEYLAREDVQLLLADRYNEFFRSLRIEDVDGSTGMHRIRMEVIRRTNVILDPLRVEDALIVEIVMQ